MKPEIREAQLKIGQKIDNIAIVNTTDMGIENQIHPPNKQPVGERLVLAAKSMVYHQNFQQQACGS